MSGPTTVLIGADPISILLAAAAIRAAEAIAAGYAEAAHLNAEHQANRDAIGERQRSAIRQGQQAFAQEVADAENRFEQLIAAAERLGIAEQVRATRPVRPDATDPLTLAAYVRGLLALADELEAHLLTESARRMDKFGEAPVGMEIPAEFTATATQQASTQLAQRAAQPISRRLLARIAHLGAVPEHIESIARELDATPPGERADLLLLELGARIHAYIEALQKRTVQEATATVVEQTLKDLGYQVEEIGSTLFVEGGVVHFRRQGWGEHMVRMRVNAEAVSANFNVIRSVAESGSHEISVRDHLAEDRWCSEFPKLKEALEVRGVRLNVTRQLAAGEVPVQLVESSKLPKFTEEESVAANPQLQSLQIKTQ